VNAPHNAENAAPLWVDLFGIDPDWPAPMTFAYADPPYLGCCRLYDHDHGDDYLCWDDIDTHNLLIDRLVNDYPDGWALSCHTPSLRHLLPLCPDDVRVGAWVKPFHAYKKGVRPAYAWEPVIYRGGRNKKPPAPPKGGKAITPKDFIVDRSDEPDLFTTPAVACNITLRKGLTGAKPERVCEWVLDLLNVRPGDEVDDLFPGTGVMGWVAEERTRPDAERFCSDCFAGLESSEHHEKCVS
jgi:hypothetical protein